MLLNDMRTVAVGVLYLFLGGGLCPAELFESRADSVDEEIVALAAMLESDASVYEKSQACKRLALIGDERCVPALAALLEDEMLGHYARYGLEGIPLPAADKALREALDHLEGRVLIGVIASLGERRDRQAVGKLGDLLQNDDDGVASAAAISLGKITTAEAVEVLLQAVKDTPSARSAALHDACFASAERLAAEDQADHAGRIYTALLSSPAVEEHVRTAAALGTLRVAGDREAATRFAEFLASPDEVKFESAIYASQERDNDAVTRALAAVLPVSSAARQVQLLEALGNRRGVELAPMIEVLRAGDTSVRIAAVTCLGRVGDETVVPVLIRAAADANMQLADAALQSLVRLEGDKVSRRLAESLEKADDIERLVIIEVLGQRQVATAVAALLTFMDSPNKAIRIAAIRALGQTVEAEDFPLLLDRIAASQDDMERATAIAAVDAACRRMADPGAVVEIVRERLDSWPAELHPLLIDVLGAAGGEEALSLLASVATDGPPNLQDAATRVLGAWITPDAAPVLYRIAASDHRFKVRSLRGYLRIARQLNLPDSERLAMCRQALEIAERADERRLILDIAKRYPAPEGIEIVAAMLDDAELRDEAAESALAIAEQIKEQHPEAAASAGKRASAAGVSGELKQRARALTQ